MGLFGKKQSHAPSVGSQSDPETLFLGTNLSIKGKVSGSGNLDMNGKIEDELELGGDLIIAPSAVVSGEIKAVKITANGNISGTLTGRGQNSGRKFEGDFVRGQRTGRRTMAHPTEEPVMGIS
jgi:Polymer-forming cytoskeletal